MSFDAGSTAFPALARGETRQSPRWQSDTGRRGGTLAMPADLPGLRVMRPPARCFVGRPDLHPVGVDRGVNSRVVAARTDRSGTRVRTDSPVNTTGPAVPPVVGR